jgi:hypothetical protein
MMGPPLPKVPNFIGCMGGGGMHGGGGGTPAELSSHISTAQGIPFMILLVPSLHGCENNTVPLGYVFSKCMPCSRGRQFVPAHAGTKMHADVW